MSVVAIVKCPDYDRARDAVQEAMELAGLLGCLAPGRRVLLKPNLLSTRKPEEAVTTHPAVTLAAGQIAQEAGCEVSLGDSPPFAGENPARYARLCQATGTSEVAEKMGIDVLRFEDASETLKHPDGRFYKSFEIARAVTEADVVVNIAKFKTHGLTAITGAVKNVFGCIPGIRKGLFHVQAAENPETFAQMLVDLLGAVRPAVHVMDAVVAMEGEGPNAGKPKQMGLILASSDPVALDAVICTIAGIDPMSIDTTRLAHEQGLGCADIASIEIKGESIESATISDFRLSSGANQWAQVPGPVRRILRHQLTASPRVDARECSGCGDCARVCPVQAITPGKPPSIDLSKCIRCYCCHEVCNFSAIALRRGWLGKLLLSGREKK